MTSINYPFYFDGVVYFGGLADAFNQNSIWKGIHTIWSIQGLNTSRPSSTSGPIYLTLQLFLLKIFGFSYQNALWVQGGVLFGLIALILWVAQLQVKPKMGTLFSTMVLSLLTLWATTSTGVFSVLPGNVFDFRIDLVGSLLLALALVALPLQNWVSALTLAVAIHERFHNLSILVGTLGLLTLIEVGRSLKQKKIPWPVVWRINRFPLYGLTGLLLLRWSHMAVQFEHYRAGYFGAEITQRGFTWGGKDFFLYYPRAFLDHYQMPSYWWPFFGLFAGLLLFKLYRISCYPEQSETTLPNSRVIWILFLGGATAYILLNLNMTRNNIGVLRFALVPGLFGMVLIFFDLCPEILLSKKRQGILLALLIIPTLVSSRAEMSRLKDFERSFDYLGFRKHNMVGKIDPIFMEIYESARLTPLTPIRVGATFYSDYNLNGLQWNIFLASHRLTNISYDDMVGSGLLYAKNFQKDQIDLLPKLNYLVMAPVECGTSEAPSNRQLSEHQQEFTSFAEKYCRDLIGSVILDPPCSIQVRRCEGGT